MKIVRSAKLKLRCSPEQHSRLLAVTTAYRDAQNHASQWAFTHGKTSSGIAIHKGCYADIRARYGLASQLACSVRDSVSAAYKTLWTMTKQSVARLKAAQGQVGRKGRLPRLYRGLDHAPVFKALTLDYHYGRDYSFKTGRQVSVMTLEGRMTLGYAGWSTHLEDLQRPDTEIGAAKLWYDRPKKQWYLLVAYTVEKPVVVGELKQVVGVDVGQRYHAVTKVIDPVGHGKITMFEGSSHRKKADHVQHLRTKLQAKGTRSAKRRLVSISARERRFTAQRNHVLARQIVDANPLALIGMEELTHIRERTERRSRPKASMKQKKVNRVRSTWSYAALRAMVTYKAPLVGSLVTAVDARYTSQTCPRCAHVSRENRPQGRERFACVNCGWSGHADVVGATNVGMKAWQWKLEQEFSGCLSAIPSREAEDVTLYDAEGGAHPAVEAEGSHKPATSVAGR
ncbi:RNA-guided endonuclease InsQ/TnpB family protein [Deinococcus seoulensis]|uniref:RNA-guided endonuclease InsQ/TnpB family protein n=1 Tax=Deinococcus seoulensis TaxID=1837379 RepID=UPI0016654DBA|nr:RNA-guided endonuclease TnpB family protein [Deinococcus seoulensis]